MYFLCSRVKLSNDNVSPLFLVSDKTIWGQPAYRNEMCPNSKPSGQNKPEICVEQDIPCQVEKGCSIAEWQADKRNMVWPRTNETIEPKKMSMRCETSIANWFNTLTCRLIWEDLFRVTKASGNNEGGDMYGELAYRTFVNTTLHKNRHKEGKNGENSPFFPSPRQTGSIA